MMNRYVQNQAAQGKKVLFVGSVGDNFYSTGLKDDSHWYSQWANVYGTNDPNKPLYNVPWLSVMGNHDHGNDDPTCACGKGCKQFNGFHRPGGTEKYWMPDYFWHYGPIPGVDLEVIGLDSNAVDVGNLGGDGCNGGARVTCEICGGQGNIQGFLSGKKADGEGYLDWRAKTTTAKTALIIQHYDGALGMEYKRRFHASQDAAGKNGQTHVVSAFGHAHDQVCMGDRTHGCDVILTGGGGGWQGGGYFGFTAVHLNDDGSYQTVLESSDVRFPQNTCNYLSDKMQANATSTAEQQFV